MRYILVTTPRTGSNYLFQLILQKSHKVQVLKSHDIPKSNRQIITIARDPKETILSNAAMMAHSGIWNNNDFSGLINNYIKDCNALYKKAKIIIDYNDLINHPEETVQALLKRMYVKYVDNEYVDRLDNNQKVGYLVSSQTSIYYHMLEPLMDTLDLSEAYEIYNKMISKAMPLYEQTVIIGT